ncbi:hypothetical protein NDR87_17455 [Nocardia sp. CDC159]|uniref:Uncharacterized protein n=1 Tax=Nocardia pulmonis TaxID=2951408 RepID=A0A9X2ED47_9NOCA|nr:MULTISPECIES: hypothetical protein [Nocardia]MCM6775876.1 hypothetical protein [Nocardia pulmonis]MCM6788148.1 hypothetical protein [Nocardia sp. CDC159]
MALLTVQLPQGATMSDALRELHLTENDVDTGYGLIPVDPATGLFALRVTDSAAARLTTNGTGATVFADPRIEPVGRPSGGNSAPA